MKIPGLDCGFDINGRPKYAPWRNSTYFTFKNGETGFFYIRGAVVWPTENNGIAVVAGEEIDSRTLVVLDECRFDFVKTLVTYNDNGDREISTGFASYARKWITDYLCHTYFWSGDKKDKVHRRHYNRVLSSDLFKTKSQQWGLVKPPQFIRVPLADDELIVDRIIYERKKTSKIIIPENSILWEALDININEDATKVLRCLVGGYETYPWRKSNSNKMLYF